METTNTTVQDALGNQVVVPAGFKIVNPNDYVTDGIIIEDINYANTKGSQFVWIPIGDVIKEDKTITNIKLSRYTFSTSGTLTDQGSNVLSNYYSEVNQSEYGNITAKENIESEDSGFRKSAITNHGYYLGRYEARTNVERQTATTDNKLTQVTEKAEDYVYNYITQPQAANLSRNMYSNTPFQSDLINSYSWDTAVVFLQLFDNRTNKTKPYSMQNSLNTSNIGLASKGTNNSIASNKDVVCNIYDMASNCREYSTETIYKDSSPCLTRGGVYYGSYRYTSYRSAGDSINNSNCDGSFRPILYL